MVVLFDEINKCLSVVCGEVYCLDLTEQEFDALIKDKTTPTKVYLSWVDNLNDERILRKC